MSIKIRRYISDKSNFLSTDPAPLTAINIPGSIGFSDLTQSRVILDMEVHAYEPTLAPSGGNFANPDLEVKIPCTFGRGGQMIGAQSIIRNSKVRSRNFGLLNEQRHQNVISSNFDWYLKSRAKEDTMSTFGNSTSRNFGIGWKDLLPQTPFFSYDGTRPIDLATQATTVASTRRADIPIPWKHVDQLATISQFPNVAVNDIRYELEFEPQIQVMFPAVMPTQYELIEDITEVGGFVGNDTNPLITVRRGAEFNRLPKVGDFVSIYYAEDPTVSDAVAQPLHDAYIISVTGTDATQLSIVLDNPITVTASNIAVAVRMFYGDAPRPFYRVENATAPASGLLGDLNSPLSVLDVYNSVTALADQAQCPFYVGCPVIAVASNDVTKTVFPQATTVSGLQRDGTNLLVFLADPIDVGGPDACVQTVLAHRDWSEGAKDAGLNGNFVIQWRINECYAELMEPQLTSEQLTQVRSRLSNLEIPWVETRLIQKNMPSTTTHTEVVQIDSGCLGMTCLSPQNLELLSGFDNCQSYRYAINGVATTNRDIQVGPIDRTQRQLHNHLLKKFYANLGVPLSKYDAEVIDYARVDNKRTHSHFPLVTPLIPAPQTIQLQLFGDSQNPMASKNLFFVSLHTRLMKITNGRVVMQMPPLSAG